MVRPRTLSKGKKKVKNPDQNDTFISDIINECLETVDCNICCEDVSKSSIVECPMCQYECCLDCVENYISESKTQLSCMSCKTGWSNEFLSKLPKKFQEKYKILIKDIYISREKSLIPQTIENDLEQYNRASKCKQDNTIIEKKLRKIREQIKLLKQKKIELENRQGRNRYIMDPVRFRALAHFYNVDDNSEQSIKSFVVCPCPYTDPDNDESCRSMIKSPHFKCEVCDTTICRLCHETITISGDYYNVDTGKWAKIKDHKCDKDVVKTIRAIVKDSKPCPGCSKLIHKYEGCAQMWCTQCHTAFDWNSGKIVYGSIHNPHAIEWERNHGGNNPIRNINDIPCGGLLDNTDVIGSLVMIGNPYDDYGTGSNHNMSIRFVKFQRFVGEFDRALDKFRILDTEFRDLRLDYITNLITEKQWTQKIYNKERENARRQVYLNVFTLFRNIVVERLRSIFEENMEVFPEINFTYQHNQFDGFAYAIFTDIHNTKKFTDSALRKIVDDNEQRMFEGHDRAVGWYTAQMVRNILFARQNNTLKNLAQKMNKFKNNVEHIYKEIIELIEYCNNTLEKELSLLGSKSIWMIVYEKQNEYDEYRYKLKKMKI